MSRAQLRGEVGWRFNGEDDYCTPAHHSISGITGGGAGNRLLEEARDLAFLPNFCRLRIASSARLPRGSAGGCECDSARIVCGEMRWWKMWLGGPLVADQLDGQLRYDAPSRQARSGLRWVKSARVRVIGVSGLARAALWC